MSALDTIIIAIEVVFGIWGCYMLGRKSAVDQFRSGFAVFGRYSDEGELLELTLKDKGERIVVCVYKKGQKVYKDDVEIKDEK